MRIGPRRVLGLGIAAASLLAATPAASQAIYSVRNDTPTPYSCGLKRYNSMVLDRFLLQPGGEWTFEAVNPRVRTLRCDTFHRTPRFYMRPGVRYALVRDEHSGRVVMRPIN